MKINKYSNFEGLANELKRYGTPKTTKLFFGISYVRKASWRWVIFPTENPNLKQKILCYLLLFLNIANGAKKPSNNYDETIFKCNMNKIWNL